MERFSITGNVQAQMKEFSHLRRAVSKLLMAHTDLRCTLYCHTSNFKSKLQGLLGGKKNKVFISKPCPVSVVNWLNCDQQSLNTACSGCNNHQATQ